MVVSSSITLHLGLPIPQPDFHQLVQEYRRVLLTVLHEYLDHLEPLLHKAIFIIPFQRRCESERWESLDKRHQGHLSNPVEWHRVVQERDLVSVLVLYHIRTEIPRLQPHFQRVLNVYDSVPDFLAAGDYLCHVGGGIDVRRVSLWDAEKMDFDSNGMDQYEMREWTDVEVYSGFSEHMTTIAHGASPQAIDASAIERGFVERLKPVLGSLCVPQGILTGKRDVEL